MTLLTALLFELCWLNIFTFIVSSYSCVVPSSNHLIHPIIHSFSTHCTFIPSFVIQLFHHTILHHVIIPLSSYYYPIIHHQLSIMQSYHHTITLCPHIMPSHRHLSFYYELPYLTINISHHNAIMPSCLQTIISSSIIQHTIICHAMI